MNLNVYQKMSERTLIDKPDFDLAAHQSDLATQTLKIGVIAAQINEAIKKGIFHQHGLKTDELTAMILDLQNQSGDDLIAEVDDYDKVDSTPSKLSGLDAMMLWTTNGLLGEVGELAQMIEKRLTGKTLAIDGDKFREEMGDLLWYCSSLCTLMGIEFGSAAEGNIAKLKKRFPSGWDHSESPGYSEAGTHPENPPATWENPYTTMTGRLADPGDEDVNTPGD